MRATIKILSVAISCLFVGLAVGYFSHFPSPQADLALPNEVANVARDIKVIVKESDSYNRTLYLDTSNWYCKTTIITGGSNPNNWDLADPNAKIVFFFLEDIADSTKADNYGDLIIRMNPIIDNGTKKMAVVFYAEGGYDKFVYFKSELLHHYTDSDKTTNYGIRLIDLQ